MPLILDQADIQDWIHPETDKQVVKNLMKPYPETEMSYHSITTDAGNARKNRNLPEIKDKVNYPELGTKTLF